MQKSGIRDWNGLKVDIDGNIYRVVSKTKKLKLLNPNQGEIHTSLRTVTDSGETVMKMKTISCARIVYEAWSGEKLTEDDIIMHRDGNENNFAYSNLEKTQAATWNGMKVSRSGNVYKVRGNVPKMLKPTSGNGIHFPVFDEDGNPVIGKNGKQQLRCINRARISYEAWTGETLSASDVVVFKDGNPMNCSIDNLEKMPLSEYREKYDKNRSKKLTEEEWNKIRWVYEHRDDPRLKGRASYRNLRYVRVDKDNPDDPEKNLVVSLSTIEYILATDENGNYKHSYKDKKK